MARMQLVSGLFLTAAVLAGVLLFALIILYPPVLITWLKSISAKTTLFIFSYLLLLFISVLFFRLFYLPSAARIALVGFYFFLGMTAIAIGTPLVIGRLQLHAPTWDLLAELKDPGIASTLTALGCAFIAFKFCKLYLTVYEAEQTREPA